MDLDEFNKYLKGEAAYNFIDDSVKRNDDEKLLYAFEDEFNLADVIASRLKKEKYMDVRY